MLIPLLMLMTIFFEIFWKYSLEYFGLQSFMRLVVFGQRHLVIRILMYYVRIDLGYWVSKYIGDILEDVLEDILRNILEILFWVFGSWLCLGLSGMGGGSLWAEWGPGSGTCALRTPPFSQNTNTTNTNTLNTITNTITNTIKNTPHFSQNTNTSNKNTLPFSQHTSTSNRNTLPFSQNTNSWNTYTLLLPLS